MLIVHVKRYLTTSGLQYFVKEWFPKAFAITSQQRGFISFHFLLNEVELDRVDMTLKFSSEEALEAWRVQPIHDALRDELDAYQSRDYWEAVRTQSEEDLSKLLWKKVSLSLNASNE